MKQATEPKFQIEEQVIAFYTDPHTNEVTMFEGRICDIRKEGDNYAYFIRPDDGPEHPAAFTDQELKRW
jgi:hypothetical protein